MHLQKKCVEKLSLDFAQPQLFPSQSFATIKIIYNLHCKRCKNKRADEMKAMTKPKRIRRGETKARKPNINFKFPISSRDMAWAKYWVNVSYFPKSMF
jgi:hypothetical protein